MNAVQLLENELVNIVRMYAQNNGIPDKMMPHLLRIAAERWELAIQAELDERVRELAEIL